MAGGQASILLHCRRKGRHNSILAKWQDNRMSGCQGGMNGRQDGRMVGRMDGCIAEGKGWQNSNLARWQDDRMTGWHDERMAGWHYDKMAGCHDGRMSGWQDVRMTVQQWWANLDQAPKDLDKTIFRDLSPTPIP